MQQEMVRTETPSQGQELADKAVRNHARSHAFMFLLREIKQVKANGFDCVIRNRYDLIAAEQAAKVLQDEEMER